MSSTTAAPLSVLLYSHYFPPSAGGVEAYARMIALYLADHGVKVTVATGTPAAPQAELPDPYRILRRPSLAHLDAALRQSTVALSVGFHARMSVLSRLRGIPLVWVHTGHDTVCPKATSYRWQDDVFCSYSPAQCYKCLRLDSSREHTLRTIGSYHLRAAMLSSAVHVSAASIVRSRMKPPRGEVIFNGCEMNLFRPMPEVAQDLDCVLFVGRLIPEKGGDLFLQAIALARKNGAPALRGTICGDGPDRPRLERLAQDLGLGELIEWRGSVPRDRLPVEINRSLAVVNAQHGEWVFGIAGIEVMACGRALISTRPADPTEIPESAAFLVARRDAADLARAMVRLRNDGATRERLERDGRAFVQKHHDLELIGAEYLSLVQRVAATATPTPT